MSKRRNSVAARLRGAGGKSGSRGLPEPLERRTLFATVMGTVFLDANGNTAWDDPEPGQSGWRVYVDANANNAHDDGERSALTDARGHYVIEGLPAGTHRVRQVDRAGFTRTAPDGNGTHEVTLGADGREDGLHFGNRRTDGEEPLPPAELASIRGIVFNDLNGDGARQDGEPALGGWTIYLDQNGNGQRDDGERAAVTSGTGNYAFEELTAGRYRVRQVLPAGWTVVRPDGGFYDVTLADGQAANERVFANQRIGGEAPPVGEDPPESGTVGGEVFDDLDADGARDEGEAGVRGVRVYLDTNGNGRRDRGEPRAVTDAGGAYAFADVPAGRHVVQYVRPKGYRPTAAAAAESALDVSAGGRATAAAVALTRRSVLHGAIFHDANGNRTADAGEAALAGRTLFLDLNRNSLLDADEPTAITDAAGRYAFVIDPGSYRVCEAPVAGSASGGGMAVSKMKVGRGSVVARDLASR